MAEADEAAEADQQVERHRGKAEDHHTRQERDDEPLGPELREERHRREETEEEERKPLAEG